MDYLVDTKWIRITWADETAALGIGFTGDFIVGFYLIAINIFIGVR
jgi:hypothetical protein